MKDRILTKEIAELYLASKLHDLDVYTSINDNAAKVLATVYEGILNLNGLTSLTPKAAKALASFKGSAINLNGLTSLTPEVAQAFESYIGKCCIVKGHGIALV